MKKKRYTLIAAWLMLFCFIAGQVIVYSHQHHILKGIHNHADAKTKGLTQVSEKCQICDSMHHTDMELQQHYAAINLQAALFTHSSVNIYFKSFGLILADGLSPPVFIIS
ncbi:hypothetical protein LT679_12970 [Mucilaginibacter roseus]|uniref:DUF2946 domain-containing protein n=1 Tax=Mucilaginibacter roseus TaxID=1528868 RepID=A0ABS8U307_9SPHI|nr:hypothetical protein [Mucilaginibacter roseus]MCD8741520.1 hypothetical protein [Mucilaginibacter roseus]